MKCITGSKGGVGDFSRVYGVGDISELDGALFGVIEVQSCTTLRPQTLTDSADNHNILGTKLLPTRTGHSRSEGQRHQRTKYCKAKVPSPRQESMTKERQRSRVLSVPGQQESTKDGNRRQMGTRNSNITIAP